MHGIGREKTPVTNKLSSYQSADLSDRESVSGLQVVEYDAVVNLAGLANVGASFDDPKKYIDLNVRVHTTLYDILIQKNIQSRIIAVSSGAVYDPLLPMPLTEDSALVSEEKTNPYVVSKQRMEKSLGAYRQSGLQCIVARPFNHTGPGQLPGFLVPDLATQIKQSISSSKTIKVGNLKTRRDYTDVRDIVKAYADLALAPKDTLRSDLYNICSGKSYSGQEILRNLLSAFGINDNDIKIEIDESKIRLNEVMEIFGSHTRLSDDVGWRPTITFEKTLQDFVKWQAKEH